jgi:CHASE2 domain-containing sensor protein
VNLSFHNKHVPARLVGHMRLLAAQRGRSLALAAIGLTGIFSYAGRALAQAASPTGGIGAQMNLMSSEAVNARSTAVAMGCYLAAALCFFFGVWAAWQSRQPQNRETGYVGRAMAGLVLCGLFASAGVWINKASISASGGAATVNDTPAMVQFGAGG